MTPPSAPLRRTPLTDWHRAHGACMVALAGWEMPAEYSGAAGEHMAVRTRAGLFDLTHMGQVELAGKDALAAVQRMTSNDASRLKGGQAQYSALTTADGTFVDDLLVYRLAASHFLFVVNAANVEKDLAWIDGQARAFSDAAVVNTSSRYALLALQGPLALEVLQSVTGADLGAVERHGFTYGEVAGVRATISRTGYTGEDGFEVFIPPQQAPRVWEALLNAGEPAGVIAAGLHARDTLRLEAGMRLQGADIDETTSVLEAGLECIVGWEKGEFNGREALRAQKTLGLTRRMVGFEMADPFVAGRGQDVLIDGHRAGRVTSGAEAPFLQTAIGLAYVPFDRTEPGTEFDIDVGGRRARARVVPLPFYKRPKG